MENNDKDLKLIYVLKVGYNTKGEGLYEFIFSTDPTNVDVEEWGWNLTPAIDNATAPSENYIDAVYRLKTKSFDLFCLHESPNYEYMHGYHTIHALAHEVEKNDDEESENYEELFNENSDDVPLLVFHYGMSLVQIKDLLYPRKIILKNDEFVEVNTVKI